MRQPVGTPAACLGAEATAGVQASTGGCSGGYRPWQGQARGHMERTTSRLAAAPLPQQWAAWAIEGHVSPCSTIWVKHSSRAACKKSLTHQ